MAPLGTTMIDVVALALPLLSATWSAVEPVSGPGIRCELASPVRLPGHRGWASYYLPSGSATVNLAPVATQLTLIAEE